jgi:hypothetical protein
MSTSVKRRRLDRINAAIADVIDAMRDGAALHFDQSAACPHWWLSNGTTVRAPVARVVIERRDVVPVGDVLFDDFTAQTWRYADKWWEPIP